MPRVNHLRGISVFTLLHFLINELKLVTRKAAHAINRLIK